MCTVTVVPHHTGVRVMCNRDESRTRPAALAPRAHHLGARRAAFPLDPRGGGTWVGVNDCGLVVALLNVHARRRPVTKCAAPSRGWIVRHLLRCRSLAQARAAATALDAEIFDPFRVVIVDSRTILVATNADERSVACTRMALEHPLLFTSSSLGDALVEPPRRRLFERMVLHHPERWEIGQARFHEHQWRLRPEISVRMERDDALTVSRTVIDVTNRECRLVYEAPVNGSRREVRACCSLH